MKKAFTDLFRVYPDGSIEPRMAVSIGPVTIRPGARIQRGVKISGIDFWQIIDRELEVEEQDSQTVLRGYYGSRVAT